MKTLHWTSRDLEALPDKEGVRYEIIDGELYVSTQPHDEHQLVSSKVWMILYLWSNQRKNGRSTIAPGVIFTEDNAVAPDVIWMSNERLATAYRDGKYYAAPELAVEILSPGKENERRDREIKLSLYSRQGVLEYWIINRMKRHLDIYRRDENDLRLYGTFSESDVVQSPYLPGFMCHVNQFFDDTFIEQFVRS